MCRGPSGDEGSGLTSEYLLYVLPVTDQTVLTYGTMSTLGECSLFPAASGKQSQCNVSQPCGACFYSPA